MGMVKKSIAIHANFYQPNRDDPWSFKINEETSNKSYSNYNDLIIDECYGPLSLKRIKTKLDETVSIYSYISFNFGSALINYIEKEYPKLYLAILEADIISKKLFPYPAAIAQVYNHSILPLVSLSKKRLYVKWGIENFKRHFKREPLGMWLGETAVDEETLDVLIENGIDFTILSPTQARRIKNINTEEQTEISSYKDLDTSKFYIWRSRQFDGKKIKIFFYNKDISDTMSRELENTAKFILRIKETFSQIHKNQVCFIASDGENYGHHIKNGDIYLNNLIKNILTQKNMFISNIASLSQLETDFEVEIINNSSRSCPHGTKRWENECGCRLNPSNTYQGWRKTLKESVDKASRIVDDLYLKNLDKIKDPLTMLNNYINIYENSDPQKTIKFIEENSRVKLTAKEITSILKTLESQMDIAFAYTSDAWSFDDILNIETLYSIKRLIKINQYLKESSMDSDIIEKLKNEKSNFKRDVRKEIEKIENTKYKELYICEFLLLLNNDFTNPFLKSRHHIKIIDEKNEVYYVKLTDIITLEEELYTVLISEEKGNPVVRIKKSNSEVDRGLIEKKDFSDFTPFVISEFSSETRNIIKLLTSKDEKDKYTKMLLYSISSFDESEASKKNLKEIFKKAITSNNPGDIPLMRDITKLVIKLLNRSEKDDMEILNLIQERINYKLLWKVGMYDNQKILS